MSSVVTQFGPVVNDISGMGDTHELLGGDGTCRWKQLINGMHLNGPWNCVEYVVIPPEASCGRHTHLQTEEIYYILSGTAEMDLNGEQVALCAGDLVTASIGTSHGTVNRGDVDMEFLVVEVFPGTGSSPAPVLISVEHPSPGDPVQSKNLEQALVHRVDLSNLFTGPWRSFATIELPPGATLEQESLQDGDEVLFVTRGSARLEYSGSVVEGERGLCVGIPPGVTRAVANTSEREPLELLSTAVGLG